MTNQSQNDIKTNRMKNIVWVGVILGPILLFLFFASTHFTGEHEVGIKINKGKIVGEATTGFEFTTPFITKVVSVPITTQERNLEGVSSATIDNYDVANSRIEYNYRIPQKKAIELYRKHPNYDALIQNEVENATKDVIGQFKLIAIPENREKIGNHISEMVQKRLTKEIGVNFQNASLTYYQWGDEAKRAIRSIQQAQRKKEQEEEKLKALEVENKRLSKEQEAKNEREMNKISARLEREELEQESKDEQHVQKAKSKASAQLIEAEAEAEALEKIASVIQDNPMLLRRQSIEAWDGKMPVIGNAEMRSRIDIDMEEIME